MLDFTGYMVHAWTVPGLRVVARHVQRPQPEDHLPGRDLHHDPHPEIGSAQTTCRNAARGRVAGRQVTTTRTRATFRTWANGVAASPSRCAVTRRGEVGARRGERAGALERHRLGGIDHVVLGEAAAVGEVPLDRDDRSAAGRRLGFRPQGDGLAHGHLEGDRPVDREAGRRLDPAAVGRPRRHDHLAVGDP